jgi:hypothetical protein
MGGFNTTLFLEDKSCGSSRMDVGMHDLKNCIDILEVSDVKGLGFQFTWSKKPKEGTGILKKLDRVMANSSFIDLFPAASVVFLPYRISDHCLCVLKIPIIGRPKQKPFKFANFLATKPGFKDIVTKAWAVEIHGVP